jgi:lipopolysaccharide/colanic/teichoic acid biosynthesis glycosyltransferase
MFSLDLLWIAVSISLVCFLRYGTRLTELPASTLLAFLMLLLECALIWTILWPWLGLDGSRSGWRYPAIISQLLLGTSIVLVTMLASGYLVRIYISRLVGGYFGVLMLSGLLAIRIGTHSLLMMRYRSGAVRRLIIVGSGAVALEAAVKIGRHPEILCQVVGFLFPEDSSLEVLPEGMARNVIGVRTCGILDLLEEQKVDELVFAAPRNGNPRVAELMDQSVKRGFAVSIIPQPYELYLSAPELMDLDGFPILRLRHSAWKAAEPGWKRMLDLSFAFSFLVLSLPLMLAGAMVLKITKGKGFCRERRCGKGGKPFWMFRLNSPRRELNLPVHERMLQHLSVTELPQLINVLRGDMSLVGPRPEGVESICHYTDWHRQRLNVRPGITGLAQVHGLRDQNSLEEKTRYDLQYILRRSLLQDVSLLLQTIWTLIVRLTHLRNLAQTDIESAQRSRTSTSPA